MEGCDGRSLVLKGMRCPSGSAQGVNRYSGALPSYAEVLSSRGDGDDGELWLCLVAINCLISAHDGGKVNARIQSTSTANPNPPLAFT